MARKEFLIKIGDQPAKPMRLTGPLPPSVGSTVLVSPPGLGSSPMSVVIDDIQFIGNSKVICCSHE